MADEKERLFKVQAILQQAQINAIGLAVVIQLYLKEQGMSTEDFWEFVGRQYAPSWEGVKEKTAKEIARIAALNLVSFGGKLESFYEDEEKAGFIISGFPSSQALSFAGLTREESESQLNMFKPIAEHLSFDYRWRWDGDEVMVVFSRKPGA